MIVSKSWTPPTIFISVTKHDMIIQMHCDNPQTFVIKTTALHRTIRQTWTFSFPRIHRSSPSSTGNVLHLTLCFKNVTSLSCYNSEKHNSVLIKFWCKCHWESRYFIFPPHLTSIAIPGEMQKHKIAFFHSNAVLLRCQTSTRHRASTSMYSVTFCVRVMSPERHHWKPQSRPSQ